MPPRGNRPSKEVSRDREIRCFELRRRGWLHEAIARELGIHRVTVTRILSRLDKRALQRLSQVVESKKVAQTEQLDWIISQCLRAWEKSKTPLRRAARKSVPLPGQEPAEPGIEQQTTEVIERDGDVSFLHAAMA